MKAGLAVCSNGVATEKRAQIDELVAVLGKMGIEAVLPEHAFCTVDEYSGSNEERANDLMRFYDDESVDVIFDISGGDLANGVLRYLDYDRIRMSKKVFWGYSDLTTVINAIYAKSGKPSVLYQIRTAVWKDGDLQQKRVRDYFDGVSNDLFDIRCRFLQGTSMEGVIVGGNIRCLLKLAGTKYWPEMEGKILLLESLGGESGVISSLLNQLDQIGVFQQVSGVLLGTFTSYEKAGLQLSVFDLLKRHISDSLPVAKTAEIGHGTDSKAIMIGREYRFAVE